MTSLVPGQCADPITNSAEARISPSVLEAESIAVAPAGYSELPHTAANRIGVAYDRTTQSDAALAAAAAAGARLSIPLRLYRARPASARDKVPPHVEELARDAIAAGLTALPPQLEATGVVLDGDAGEVIAAAARDDDVGLLYVGSRGHGPLREVVFGGATGSLLRAVHCLLIIVPRHT